jgi:hypothetical protein
MPMDHFTGGTTKASSEIDYKRINMSLISFLTKLLILINWGGSPVLGDALFKTSIACMGCADYLTIGKQFELIV